MNITVLAKKGGVGKSTVSLVLYEAFRQKSLAGHYSHPRLDEQVRLELKNRWGLYEE